MPDPSGSQPAVPFHVGEPLPPAAARAAATRAAFQDVTPVAAEEAADLPDDRAGIRRQCLPAVAAERWSGPPRPDSAQRFARGTRGSDTILLVGLFQDREAPGLFLVDLEAAGLRADAEIHLVDQWTGQYLGRAGARFHLPVEAEACRVVAVQEVQGEPILLASDGHVLGPLHDVIEVRRETGESGGRLWLRLRPQSERSLHVTLVRPDGVEWIPPTSGPGPLLQTREDGLTTLEVPAGEDPVTVELPWQRTAGPPPRPRPPTGRVQVAQPAPALCTLTWSGSGEPAAEDEDRLASLCASLRPGTHLLVVPPKSPLTWPLAPPAAVQGALGWAVGRIPAPQDRGEMGARLEDLALPGLATSDHWFVPEDLEAPHLDLTGDPISPTRGAPALVLAPQGRGTLWLLPAGTDLEPWVRWLGGRESAREVEDALAREFRRRAAATVRQTHWEGRRAVRACDRFLDVGMPDVEAHFQYLVVVGGDLVSCTARDASGLVNDLGRQVRGREEFTLPLDAGTLQEQRAQLVIVRRTAPRDRGRILRVELDGQEDLGPWHLGDGGQGDHWSTDRLVIGPDLLSGRSVHLALRCDEGAPVTSFRYDFLLESEPDGAWLSEWEPETVRREVWFDRTPTGAPAVCGGEWWLRALVVRPGTTLHFDVPPGYPWFDARVGVLEGSERFRDLRFRVLLDGSERFASPLLRTGEVPRPARVHLPAGGRLTLECEGPADADLLGAWGQPLLLRH